MDGQVKTFVIDTNVFIHKPDAILSFRDNEVAVPLSVLEELDHLKSMSDERGRSARHAIRFLDAAGRHGSLNEGVKIDNNIQLRVVGTHGNTLPPELTSSHMDNRILATALYLQREEDRHVFFVSKDINARVKAQALGLRAVDYEKQKVDVTDMYLGWRDIPGTVDEAAQLEKGYSVAAKEPFLPNEFIHLVHKDRSPVTGRYDSESGRINPMVGVEDPICGIRPLNEQQQMAFDLLLDDSIPLVTLVGKAGTGKTLLAIASGLHKVLEEKSYTRVLVSRPVIPMGKDIGFLPGAKTEKLAHWMQPLFDNLELILSQYKKPNYKNPDALVRSNLIEIEALTYIRGRSLPKQFIIIDEAQNLSPHEIKTIVSRAGEGTKVILSGDPYQIDSPYLDSSSNGLSYLVEAFKGQRLFGHVTLEKTERSPLAELAAELL